MGLGAITKALVTDPITGYIASDVDQRVQDLKSVRGIDKTRERANKRLGVDLGAVQIPGYHGGAFWLPKQSAKDYLTYLGDAGLNLQREVREKIKAQRGKEGLVVVGEDYTKPAVLAHELGHAKAYQSGNWLERGATHAALATGPDNRFTHKLPSVISAVLAGKRYGALKGALAGLGAGLITESPTLIAENAANRYAEKFLTKKQLEDTKGLYTPQWLNYAAGASLPFAMIGGLVGGGPKIMNMISKLIKRR